MSTPFVGIVVAYTIAVIVMCEEFSHELLTDCLDRLRNFGVLRTTAVFTDAEWAKLQSVWAYTGAADALIAEHTISELRQVLANM